MGGLAAASTLLDAAVHEIVLFAAIGLLIGGVDDLATDLVHFGRSLRPRPAGQRASPGSTPYRAGRLAVFVPAWDESTVIGLMLRSALARFDHPDFRIYAGAYPNDPGTLAAIGAVAAQDARVRLVVCRRPGPTTKADCLNALWHALLADQREEGRPFKGVVLHDAEDLVHPEELRLLDQGLDQAATVQLPVLPLPDLRSRWISGHYIDEFAETKWLLPQPLRRISKDNRASYRPRTATIARRNGLAGPRMPRHDLFRRFGRKCDRRNCDPQQDSHRSRGG